MDEFAEWRARYCAAAPTDEPSPEAPPPEQAESIDLDDEANVTLLEDPALLAHMSAMRAEYREAEAALAAVPAESAVRLIAAKGMNSLSSVVIALDEKLLVSGSAGDEVHVIGSHLRRWVAGSTVEPHLPTPAPPGAAAALSKVIAALERSGERLKTSQAELKTTKNQLAQARMELIQAWDGFQRLCEVMSKNIQSQRQLLKAASAVYNYQENQEVNKYAEVMNKKV